MKRLRFTLPTLIAGFFVFAASNHGIAATNDLLQAEESFWAAAERTENTGIISAYLLHFTNGRFADRAARLYQQETGEAWTPQVADKTAWRDRANDALPGLSDTALAGRWAHKATCDVNFFVQDVEAQSEQLFKVAATGGLDGESSFRSGDSFKGQGEILELRRNGSVVTYVMAAQNSLTGAEVHIGILNLRQSSGQFLTRGWEMNTGGAYCDLAGQKVQ